MVRFLLFLSLLSFSSHAAICPEGLAKLARTLTTWRTPPDIKNAEYGERLLFYSQKKGKPLSPADKPKTPEQKLALFDAFRPEDLRVSFDSLSKADKKWLLNRLEKMDFESGVSKKKFSRLFIDTYLLSHASSDSLLKRWRLGEDAFLQKQVEKRFIEEFSKNGLFEATKKFGILLPETRKEKTFNYIASYFSKKTQIPSYLINKILKNGFEANYPELEKIFVESEKAKASWNHLKRGMSFGVFWLFCFQDYSDQEDEKKRRRKEAVNLLTDTTDEASTYARDILENHPPEGNSLERLLNEWMSAYIQAHGHPPREGTREYLEYQELRRELDEQQP